MSLGLLGIIEQFVLTMHEIGHAIVQFFLSHAQVFYSKCPGMKLENWDAATCRPLAQISTTLV